MSVRAALPRCPFVRLLALPYLRPPFLPPLRELDLLRFFPRPPPPFLRPPLSDLLTVAHARRAASLLLTPRFLYPRSIFDAFRFCFRVYFFLLPRAINPFPLASLIIRTHLASKTDCV